ncbi:uncharacterized protein LOC127254729 [Andrographis paniculata]|uniref:uncharacterized protein LOC127254729 n=1 Tax=Andrographis paniculata TaxID=175694 RepID=UPI0021E7BEDB|nr:uncharacterized protein LOC127254729 [Andrographis paniculata]
MILIWQFKTSTNFISDILIAMRAPPKGNVTVDKGETPPNEGAIPLQEPHVQNNLPEDGAEWVNLFANEMMSATTIDDARCREANFLESPERTISSRASAEAAQNFPQENLMLKEHIEALRREIFILKRAAIQHECQKEYDEKDKEVQQLKQVVAQYREQLRTLEVNNYALMLHFNRTIRSPGDSIRISL